VSAHINDPGVHLANSAIQQRAPDQRVEATNAGQKRKRESSPPQEIAESMEFEPTQKATQPLRQSEISEYDASDIICTLNAQTPAAFEAIKATMLAAPQHILPNDDLENLCEQDFDLNPELSLSKNSRCIALRISSKVVAPRNGFTFGRSSEKSDILLVSDAQAMTISSAHFKIHMNSQGSLMLEDTSMNGTLVDDDHLLKGAPKGPNARALQHGAIISVIGLQKAEVKFLVSIQKNRGEHQQKYEQNLRKYLKARGKIAQFGSMRESTYGNHWDGGKLYNFTGLLGKGAFAMVYKVQTKNKGTVFAAKELDKRRFIKNGILDIKFDNELKIMKQLNHPNIVQYEDYHEFEQWIYIFMEYVPHGELSKELRENGPLPEPMIQTITRQVLHALEYLHRRNITHRDIKPDNILIASRDPLIVKLSDFGLSKSVKNQETFLKTFCGTLLYCAPEIYPDYGTYVRGQAPKRRRPGEAVPRGSPYNQSVDMWSFGAVLFHLLCDKAPIMGRGDDRGAQMLNNIMTKTIDFEPLRKQGVSAECVDFISHLLNRNPILRPNEQECFQHPWLINVGDALSYVQDDEVEDIFSQELQAVQEEDEEDLLGDEDIDAYAAMYEVISPRFPPAVKPQAARPMKKPRMGTRNRPGQDVDDSVIYPTLPVISSFMAPPASTAPPRLFGEITPSIIQTPSEDMLRSSGVLGETVNSPNVPQIRDQFGQISVKDFHSMDTDMSPAPSPAEVSSGDPLQSPEVLGIARTAGPAPSLFGAEMEIEDLNMASPDVGGVSDAATPDTTNPVTPREIDPSPSSARTKSTEKLGVSDPTLGLPKFERKIDLRVLDDDAAYSASMAAREASRTQMAATRASTFQNPSNSLFPADTNDMARTIDARTGKSVSISDFPNPPRRNSNPSNALSRRIDLTVTEPTSATASTSIPVANSNAVPPPSLLGTLTTSPTSYTSVTIPLHDRMTSWGRSPNCTLSHPDKQDTRIPKNALKIMFWAPGMEKWIASGKDWWMVHGIRTILSTSTSKCVWVNGVELRAQSNGGEEALYGKVYTGDVVTVWEGGDGMRLDFVVEIAFWGSSGRRPEGETGFQVLRERHWHQRMLAASKAVTQ
jgi:serine/threonine protein kinase